MSGTDPVIDEYNRTAPEYDQRWDAYIQASVSRTLERLHLRADDHVLDVGCGTGILLARIMQQRPAIHATGVDAASAMLTEARRRLPETVPLQVGRADALPFGDDRFTQLVSSSAFHFMRDPQGVLAEFRRVLVPGGHIVITDWCVDFLTMRLLDWRLRLTDRAHYRTWGTQDMHRMLQHAGFAEIAIDRYRIDWHWGLMTASATNPGSTQARHGD